MAFVLRPFFLSFVLDILKIDAASLASVLICFRFTVPPKAHIAHSIRLFAIASSDDDGPFYCMK
jgi:hypothetical protein